MPERCICRKCRYEDEESFDFFEHEFFISAHCFDCFLASGVMWWTHVLSTGTNRLTDLASVSSKNLIIKPNMFCRMSCRISLLGILCGATSPSSPSLDWYNCKRKVSNVGTYCRNARSMIIRRCHLCIRSWWTSSPPGRPETICSVYQAELLPITKVTKWLKLVPSFTQIIRLPLNLLKS